jgi:hypothetical protein
VTEIDAHIAELLESARLTPRDAEGDWADVIERSQRRQSGLRIPVRGALLAAALLIGLGAAAQAKTGVFSFSTDHPPLHDSTRRPSTHLTVRMRRTIRVTGAAYSGIIGTLPRNQVSGISTVNMTTAARMAQVFGGEASRYPDRAGVVLVEGPFSISLYLQGCKRIPTACPAPIGRWAWFAYAVLPSPRTGPRAGLPTVRTLRAGPAGQPLPDLSLLGRVTAQTYIPRGDPRSVARQHQGQITIVSQRRSGLTISRVKCKWGQGGYTERACQAIAEYAAFLREPRPDEPHPSRGSWTRVSGVIGGWRGNLIVTPARLADAPPALRGRISGALAALPARPITRIPPPLKCVARPDLCVPHTAVVDIRQVIAVLNHHGLDAHTIPVSEIPAQYRAAIPKGLTLTGAATNAGLPAVARRGYVFSLTFDHAPEFMPTYVAFRNLLGPDWGIFPDANVLTVFHPFTPEAGKHRGHNNTGFAILRDLDRLTGER